ncbi:hypothetical protein, partial [Xenorhabdus littoralis]|uniref:hypothetical protein n=1 Tax=Xenorhabdus littoralis TaxID=2582835 RepID=UPI0029E810F5
GFVHNYALAEKRLCTIVGVLGAEESDFYGVEAKTALRVSEGVLVTGVMLNVCIKRLAIATYKQIALSVLVATRSSQCITEIEVFLKNWRFFT